MKAYRYYSTLRPVSIGTYPKDGMITFENYNSRIPIKEIGRMAWGHIDYDRKLSEKETDSYDLEFGGVI